MSGDSRGVGVGEEDGVSYSRQRPLILRTQQFDVWIRGLRDRRGRARILARIERLAAGNPGDVRVVGPGLFELRVHVGPGYRVYCARARDVVVVLLCGGDKASQAADLALARQLAEEWRRSTTWE